MCFCLLRALENSLQLPGVGTVRRWMKKVQTSQGINAESYKVVKDQIEKYDAEARKNHEYPMSRTGKHFTIVDQSLS